MPETKTPAKGGVNAPVDEVVRKEMGKVVVGKTEIGSFQASGLKETESSEHGTKLSDKAQASSPRPAVEKKTTSSNPAPMPETKTPVKAGVNASVDQAVRKEMGKVVVGKTEIGSFQASGLKETESSEHGTKLSDEAQASSPRPAVEKKTTSSNPAPMPETKTPAKGGVNAPVDEVVRKEMGESGCWED